MRTPTALGLGILIMIGGPGQQADVAPVLLTVRQANRNGVPGAAPSASVSADGRYVAFASYARLAIADTNDRSDIYIMDLANRTVSIGTLAADGRASDRDSVSPRLSGDGRILAYETSDEDQRAGIARDIVVVRDRWRRTVQIPRRGGETPNGKSGSPAVSADGRIVAFSSSATNLVDGPDMNGPAADVYTFDTAAGTIRRVSVETSGRQSPRGSSYSPSVSADGRYVAFTSTAPLDLTSSLAESPSAVVPTLYLRDTRLGLTSRISVGLRDAMPDGPSYSPAISGDGRYVAFAATATNLVPRDRNSASDVFVRDLRKSTTSLVSRSVSGESANGSSTHPAISADGNVVAFQSDASDLTRRRCCGSASEDINLLSDVFWFERTSQTMRWISRGRTPWLEPSMGPAIDGTGTVVAFSSRHPVDGDDIHNDFDLFVRVRSEQSALWGSTMEHRSMDDGHHGCVPVRRLSVTEISTSWIEILHWRRRRFFEPPPSSNSPGNIVARAAPAEEVWAHL